MLLSLNPSAGLALGVDFGHSHLRVAVSDLSHEVLAESWRELDVDHSAEEGLDAAAQLVDKVLKEARVDRKGVIGRDGPARADQQSDWDGRLLIDSARLGRRERRDGDGAPAWAPGERGERREPRGLRGVRLGISGRGHSDVVYIKLSSGVGAGLLFAGRLHEGAGGTAGEIGHIPAQNGTAICRCGSRGCLETVASARAIAEQLGVSRGEQVSPKDLLELIADGDPAASRLIGEAGREIGVALAEPLQSHQSQLRDHRRRPERRWRADH